MKFYAAMLTFALLLFGGSAFSICIGQICLFDQGGLAYIGQEAPAAMCSAEGEARIAPAPTLTMTVPIKDCTNVVNNKGFTGISYYLSNVNWFQATCLLVIDGKETWKSAWSQMHGTTWSGGISYDSTNDNEFGCGLHNVFVRCYNAKLRSQATEIVDSNAGTFTCSNCCAGSSPVPNLVCKDDCSKLIPPKYKKYACGGMASCSCQLSDLNVTCSSGKGNASGTELCINDCDAQAQYCDGGCICRPKQPVACSSGTGITNPAEQFCTDDCNPASTYCGPGCACVPKQQVSCATGAGIANSTTELCKDDCASLGYTCEESCSCWPDMAISAVSSSCKASGGRIETSFTFSVSPPPAPGDSYDCRVKINGIPYAYATVKAGQSGAAASTLLQVQQGAEWMVECTYKGRAYVSANSPSHSCTLDCSAGIGNATGELCRDDCAQKLGAGYSCMSNCTCEKEPPKDVLCSSGIGNASGLLCVNDCAEKLGAGYSCIGNCTCQKDAMRVSCLSGAGNASGGMCINDCAAGFVCGRECKCEKPPTVQYCSQGKLGLGLVCIDDCGESLGKEYYCDAISCTCAKA